MKLPIYVWAFLLLWLLSSGCRPDNKRIESITPSSTYLSNADTTNIHLHGPARMLLLDGLTGINTLSIRSRIEIPSHTLNLKKGSLTMWFFPLEDLSPQVAFGNMYKHNGHMNIYPFLSDSEDPQDFTNAHFKLVWDSGWYPGLIALFASGKIYDEAFEYPHRAYVSSNHFIFRKDRWYQLALTWDKETDQYRLYVNGVLVGAEDQYYEPKMHFDSCGKTLYTGNPMLCYSTTNFYSEVLSSDDVYQEFRKEVTKYDEKLEEELQYAYEGKERKILDWTPGADWKTTFSLDLTHKGELDSFYIQGRPVDVRITNEGMLVETVHKYYQESLKDSQVYVWTLKPFEGDIYVEYEFKTLRSGGLSLLMVQASGMNREDFMADYPLRTSGRMSMVCWEDVRNRFSLG